MKKYLYGSWLVIKNYIFAMIFFYIFFVGFYSKAALFSIAIFLIMFLLLYSEMSHQAGVDKRRYGSIRLYEGAVYGIFAVLPIVLIQIVAPIVAVQIISAQLGPDAINIEVLKANLIKGFAAPMLFIAKAGGYQIPGYIISWATIVLASFLGYFAGYRNFDLNAYIRQVLKLQPKQRKPVNNKRRRY